LVERKSGDFWATLPLQGVRIVSIGIECLLAWEAVVVVGQMITSIVANTLPGIEIESV
jgi:hypothetical protein